VCAAILEAEVMVLGLREMVFTIRIRRWIGDSGSLGVCDNRD
jgi:hypothetical protein